MADKIDVDAVEFQEKISSILNRTVPWRRTMTTRIATKHAALLLNIAEILSEVDDDFDFPLSKI